MTFVRDIEIEAIARRAMREGYQLPHAKCRLLPGFAAAVVALTADGRFSYDEAWRVVSGIRAADRRLRRALGAALLSVLIALVAWAAYSAGRRSHRDADAQLGAIVDAVVAAREDTFDTLVIVGATSLRFDDIEDRLGEVEATQARAGDLLEDGCVFNAQLVPRRDHGRRIALAWELAQADGGGDAEATP